MSIWKTKDTGVKEREKTRARRFWRKGFIGALIMGAALCAGGLVSCADESTGTPDGSFYTDDKGNLVNEMMVRIPGGTFTMGAASGTPNMRGFESPQRQVTLTSFYMSKYTVTQKMYKDVMGVNPSYFQGSRIPAGVNSDSLPVENVNWYDAVRFCNKLSEKEGRTPAYDIDSTNKDPNNYNYINRPADPAWTVRLIPGNNGYRLPTEAQWEYAARAGTTTPWWTGNSLTLEQANFNGILEHTSDGGEVGQGLARTTKVGSYPANKWGLYDMHGNVYELCWDWVWDYGYDERAGYHDPVYAETNSKYLSTYVNAYDDPFHVSKDPQGLPRGNRKAERGGTWHHSSIDASSAWRERIRPERVLEDVGIRLVHP
jgi:formylglycine-generating enzyme required for sulfatase activity